MTQRNSAFSRHLWATIGRLPDKPFWIGRSGTHSYADLKGRIGAMTGLLGSAGVSPGGVVLIVTSNDWIAFCAWVGCLLNGALPVLLAPDSRQGRLSSIQNLAQPSLIITDEARRGEAWVVDGSARVVTDTAISEMPGDGEGLAPSFAMPDAGTAYILFTSGSTSAPKGVMVTHDSLAAQIQTIARVFRLSERSRLFNGLVLYHVDGLVQGPLLAAAQSATLIRPEPFSPERLESDMDWLAADKATHMVAAPTLLEMIDRFCKRDDYFSHAQFTAILSSSAKLPAALWDRFENRFSVALINEYGMTETVAASHFAGPFPEMGARHTIGRPVDCQARVVDPRGKECAAGEVGELQIKGKIIFTGYFGDPVRTRGVFQDGWFRTNDLACVTDTGDFEIAGRLDAAINSGGFLLFPEEIDEVLSAYPNISEAQTVGVADDIFGQVAYAAYVADRPIDPADVMTFCRQNLEPRKVPKRLIQIAGLPRTGSGKPDIGALRTLLLERGPPSDGGDTLESRILEIAAQVFGVPTASLTLSDTPDTVMGWDSYAHTALLLEVEQNLGIEISTADMLAIGSLADLLQTVLRIKSGANPENGTQLRRVRAGTGAGSIVALPGIGGRSFYIRRFLDSLDNRFEVHAISFPSSAANQSHEFSIRDAAHDYATEIFEAGLSEPLVLIGPSFGGFLAYETAASLAAYGKDVASAVLLDTAVPWTHRRARHLHRIARYIQKIRRHFTRRRDPKGARDNDVTFEIPEFRSLVLRNLPEAQQKTVQRSYTAFANYKPSRANVPMLVFAAQNRRRARIPIEPNLGWGRFNSGPITTIHLGENHGSIVRDDDLAARAANEINRILSIGNTPRN